MKRFFKKIAFVMALAMVLTNIGPVAKASAAAAPGLRYTTRVLYLGGSAYGGYTDNCWTPSQNTDGYQVSYEVTSGKNLITVAKNGKITATGNGIGKAVVAVSYAKEGEKTITKNFTIKVRRNATAVRLTNATIAALDEALEVGAVVELIGAKSITTPASYAKGNYGLNNFMGVTSDQIDYKVSDEEVIKVEGNKLTAVGAGVATLTVYTYQYGDAEKQIVKEKSYTISVLGGIADIKQTNLKTFEVKFAQALEEDPASDAFKITRNDATKLNVAVNTTKLSDDKKTVTLTTFIDLNDGAEYVLTYDEKEYTFKATDNVANRIGINKTTVEFDTETEIIVYVYDKNDVVLQEAKIGSPDGKLDFTFDDMGNGFVSGDKLIIWEKGKAVKLTATYHSGEFDSTTGQEIGNIVMPFTITAVDQKAVSTNDLKYTITDKTDAPNWDDAKNNEIYVKETGRYIHMYLTNSKGEDLAVTDNYTLESADENVLIVGEVLSNGGKGVYAPISAVSKSGTVSVIVKKEGKVWTTISVTIKPEKVFTNFEVSVDKNTVSNSNLNVYDTAKITLTFRDQYTNKFNINNDTVTIVSLSRPAGVTEDQAKAYLEEKEAGETKDYIFHAYDKSTRVPAGTYNYRITYKNVSRSVSIVVQNANTTVGANSTYRLELSATNIDTVYNKDNQSDKTVTIRVARLVNGVIAEYMDLNSYNITVEKGTDKLLAPYATDVDGNETKGTVTLRTVTGSAVTGSVVTKASTGSYVVTATTKDGKTTLPKTAFVVTDSQKPLTAKMVNPTVTAGSYEDAIKAAFEFYYDGSKVGTDKFNVASIKTANSGTIKDDDVHGLGKGRQIYVTEVVVQYNLPDTNANVYYEYTITLNKTITIN